MEWGGNGVKVKEGESARTFEEARCEEIAKYIIQSGATVRVAAQKFGVSKSTVHKDVSCRLEYLNSALYGEVREILERNKAERHLRGGEATRARYEMLREAEGRRCKH